MQRPHVRKLLQQLLIGDSDLDAFCSDYFPDVYRRFANSMDREQKRTILLDYANLDKVVAKLQEHVGHDNFTAALSALNFAHRLDRDESPIQTATTPVAADRSPPRGRLLTGIDALQPDWASRIGDFIDAYVGTASRPNVFCGRDEDVGEVQAWLNRTDAPPNLLVTAPAGRGKSALLVRFANELGQRDDVAVAFTPLSLRFATQRPDVFLACLVARLEHLHGREPPDLRHANVGILQGMLLEGLTRPLVDGRVLVVILDGLDEATGWSIRPGLLPAGHPPSIRIIVSARHQPDDPEGKQWRRALGWERPHDAEYITLPLLESRDVEAALGRLPAPVDRLSHRSDIVAELTRLCAGEPLTLWLMVEDIRNDGEAALCLDVSALRSREPGLAGWFKCWWKQQQEQWGDKAWQREPSVRALLNLLAVANGGLTRDDVLALVPDEIPDHFLLDDALDALSRLIHGDGKARGYVLQHPGFAKHLLDERLTQHERKLWRGRLAQWSGAITDELIKGQRLPPQVPRYVVENRAAHLDEEAAPAEQWMSLATRAWYDAWQTHEPGPSGFLDGVDRAWKEVATADVERFADEAQCALIRGSIGSVLANVQPELLKMLLEHGLWTPAQALAYIREAPIGHASGHASDNGRAELVVALAPHTPVALLPQLFDIACGLEGKPSRVDTLEDLLPRMAEVAPVEAIMALKRIEPIDFRAMRMSELAEHLAAPRRASVLEEAWKLACQITQPASRAYVLKRVGRRLAEPAREQALREAFNAACEILETEQRCYTLSDIVAELPADLQAGATTMALAAAAGLANDRRFYALERLAQELPSPYREQAVRTIEAEIQATGDPLTAGFLRIRLLELLPETERPMCLDTAFEPIGHIGNEAERARAVDALLHSDASQRMTAGLRQQIATKALRIAQSLEDPSQRIRVLVGLRDTLPVYVLWPVATPVWPAVQQALRGEHSIHIDDLHDFIVIAPVDMAIEAARQAQLPRTRAALLTTIAQRLPVEARCPIIEDALAAAREMVELPRVRAQILFFVLQAAPPEQKPRVFTAFVEATEQVGDAFWASDLWFHLARVLPEPWRTAAVDAARSSARTIEIPHVRFQDLLRLVRLEREDRRDGLLTQALESISENAHPATRLRHLTDVALAADTSRQIKLLQTALDSMSDIGDDNARVQAMTAYAAHLPPEDMDALVECIEKLGLPSERVNGYVQLLDGCPAERERCFDRALVAARAAGREPQGLDTPASFMAQLIHVAPPSAQHALLHELLNAARNALVSVQRPPETALLEDEYADIRGESVDGSTAAALAAAAPHLPADRIPEALAIAADIRSVWHRATATVPLAMRLDEPDRSQFAEQLIAAKLHPRRGFDPAETRGQLAITVAPLLAEPRRSEVLAAFPFPYQFAQPPTLTSILPDTILFDRIDRQLSPDAPEASMRPPSPFLEQLPPERRARVVDHLLGRVPALAPHVQAWLLAQVLPYAPEPWVDRCLEAVKGAGNFYHEPLRRCAPQLNTAQLDFALAVLEADQSRASPRDTRLDALGAVAAERLRRPDPPRATLRRLFHDTLRGRCETRADVLTTLSALAPLVVGLSGAAAAIDIVRTIRRVGTWWP